MSLADAVAREADWLLTSGDGLPALAQADGGPFEVVQAYLPRTPGMRQTALYVIRRQFPTKRFGQQRRLATHHFQLRCRWPIGATTIGTQLAEIEQQAFDNALLLVVQRIEGFVGDKSHGGRFMSVAEAPNGAEILVQYGDPEQDIPNGCLTATLTYTADDQDYTE
ncbi:hypothetical protein [Streptacidiphilus sp. MAP5-3]|uniref:hypothetical protein n=1 Tax=unclassified Streptacidiphilus TaxID=2643834 RepID=UPI003517F153